MKDYLSPSIMCADLMNMDHELKQLMEAKVDLIHYDLMDTTFTNQTMLPFRMMKMITDRTDIPLDIHVMIDKPERILPQLLPYAANNYVEIHVETTKEISSILQQIRSANGKPAVTLNSATPVYVLEELMGKVDMINLILGNAGFCPRQPLDSQLLAKVAKVRNMINDSGRQILLEVDGAVSFETAKKTKAMGANAFVLGTSSIYQEGKSVVEECRKLREYLSS